MERAKLNVQIWVNENIFNFKKGDGVAYLVFYIFVPVAMSWFSLLQVVSSDNVSVIYCYVTILVSAMNCIYDAANRWSGNTKRGKNIKLFVIMSSTAVTAGYCIFEIFALMITKSAELRNDYFFLIYLVTIVVAFMDIIGCFATDMAWKSCLNSSNQKEEAVK